MMLRSLRPGRLVLAVLVLAGLFGVTQVKAATAASVTLSPATVTPGTQTTIAGSGFGRYQFGQITVDGVRIASFMTRSDGRFSVRWTIPAKTAPGNHLVRAYTSRVAASATLTVPAPVTSTGYLRGVSLAGAEFGASQLPGTFGSDYTYPTAQELDYYRGKGLTLIRLPFLWERVQPALYGALSADETARIEQVLNDAAARNMRVILDVHNYGRYRGAVIGSSSVPNQAFADLWQRLATRFKAKPSVWAYGLMNEPHDMNGAWPAAAQAAVDAIRSVDSQHAVLVAGDGWSTARFWRDSNESLRVRDSASNLYYEAHIYFDDDYTGRYDQTYDGEGAYPTIGVERVKPFVEWLQATGARGFIGEYGVPGDDPRWNTVLDTFLTYLDQQQIGGAYWAGGPWWGDYPLSVEPANGQDRPQMSVLTKHLGR
jgi:endoglucanase